MFTLDGIRKFHRWTHASLTLLLDHLSTLTSETYTKELPSFGFSTLRKQMIHVFNCEGYRISTLQGLHYINRNCDDYHAVLDAVRLQQQISGQTQAYLTTLTDQQLNADTELHFSDGDRDVRTPA